ncbi:hypothetical protein ZWY2020_055232 [Hordeum vulgare]|nr:hypothetical protein ZWY2020_055232 [Hordeum vulgare]
MPLLGWAPPLRATLLRDAANQASPPALALRSWSPPVPIVETVVGLARSPSRGLVLATSLVQDQGMGPVMGSGVAPIIVEAEARAVESAIAPAVDQVDQAALGQPPPMVRGEDQVDQESLLTDSQTVAKDPEAALPVHVIGEVEEVAPSAGSEPQLDLRPPGHGGSPSLGLGGMSAQESAAYAKLKWFCSSLVKSKKLSEHKSNKASQVENVLMRALGLVPDDLDVDDMVVTEMQNIFDSPLQDQHVRVIAALFGKEVPPMDVLEKGSASEVLAL